MTDVLGPYRVLDLTNERGLSCSQILGDLGADVIQADPPGGSPAKLSRTPAEVTPAAPTLGRDNQHVLGELLGYDEARIAHLVVSGVMG